MTRATVLTGPAPAAIAVIAIQGPDWPDIIAPYLRSHRNPADLARLNDNIFVGKLFDNDEFIDDIVLIAYPEQHTAEIHCHGGQHLVRRILNLLHHAGAQLVPTDVFFPTDSLVAEVQHHLPHTLTEKAALTIAAQETAGLTAALNHLLHDHDNLSLAAACQSCADLARTFTLGSRLLTPPTIILIGPTNVGKSTLANALTADLQSITADQPGTTRDWTLGSTIIAGLSVRLIDTAGLRPPADDLEQHAIRQTHNIISHADLLLHITTPDYPSDPSLNDLCDLIPPTAVTLTVVNKADLIPPADRRSELLYISALHGIGLDHLQTALAHSLGFAGLSPTDPVVFTPRQHNLLSRAAHAPDKSSLHTCLRDILYPVSREKSEPKPDTREA